MSENIEPHCGNCEHYLEEYEDVFGMSWCSEHNHSVCCSDTCGQWEMVFRNDRERP